jgi:hypothetical protein
MDTIKYLRFSISFLIAVLAGGTLGDSLTEELEVLLGDSA